jgi:glycosyltransferase involved in cell wall biosynthesis
MDKLPIAGRQLVDQPPTISVVSPVYRAEGMIDTLVSRIKTSLEPITLNFEIILVDDRGPDNSWAKIKAQAALDPRVRGVRLSRNFGQHRAITAGLDYSRGEWIVVMDCDLQDQPEEIPKLLAYAQQAPAEIVFARRAVRQDTFLKRLSSGIFYRVLSYLTDTRQDPAIANFGIYHRKAIDAVLSLRESIRYFPTMVRWVGFRTGTVDVVHAERAEGSSSYNFRSLINLALDIILAYSDKPLRLTVKMGLLVSASAFLMVLLIFFRFLTGGIVVLGYTSLIISIWFFSGLLLSVLGMVGLYLGKTFEQVKSRPIYVVDLDTADSR